MIAPQPFFEPRGTPFSEFHRIRALTDLGHTVDLVTYPFGQDVTLPGLRVFRSWRVPFLTRVKIGPSLAKIPLDALLTLTAIRRAMSERYDAVHSHEEGGVIGVLLAAVLRVPHVYDMHSSLPQQLTNFAFTNSRAHSKRVPCARAPDDPTVPRRHRHLPVTRGNRARHRRRRAHGAHRKRTGFGGRPGDARRCRGRSANTRAWRTNPARAVHGHVRGIPGARSAVRRDVPRPPITPGRAIGAGRRQARSGGGRARAGAGRRASARSRCLPANGRPARSPRTCWRPTSSCRRDRAEPIHRSRSTSTSARASRSSRPAC